MKSVSEGTLFVTVNWNCGDTIFKQIESLLACTSEKNIYISDNGSVDGSVQKIKKLYPNIIVKLNCENIGFSKAVNIGVEHAVTQGYSYVALVNPDAYIEADWLEKLVKNMITDKNIGIATGKLIDPLTGLIDASGDNMSDWLLPYIRGEGDPEGCWDEAQFVNSATGGASLYRVSALKKSGAFDEKFFLYYEDTEIAMRFQLLGWRVFYEPKAIGYHIRNSSSKKVPDVVVQQSVRNRHLTVIKTIPFWIIFRHGYKFFLSSILFTVNKVLKGHVKAGISSFISSITITPYALRERRKLMRKRKISTRTFYERCITKGPPPIPLLKLLSKVLR